MKRICLSVLLLTLLLFPAAMAQEAETTPAEVEQAFLAAENYRANIELTLSMRLMGVSIDGKVTRHAEFFQDRERGLLESSILGETLETDYYVQPEGDNLFIYGYLPEEERWSKLEYTKEMQTALMVIDLRQAVTAIAGSELASSDDGYAGTLNSAEYSQFTLDVLAVFGFIPSEENVNELVTKMIDAIPVSMQSNEDGEIVCHADFSEIFTAWYALENPEDEETEIGCTLDFTIHDIGGIADFSLPEEALDAPLEG